MVGVGLDSEKTPTTFYLRKTEFMLPLPSRGIRPHLKAGPRRGLSKRREIFPWIRRNPLKSPNSAKGIQGNASFFAWFYLVLLGLIWRRSAHRSRPSRRTPPRPARRIGDRLRAEQDEDDANDPRHHDAMGEEKPPHR